MNTRGVYLFVFCAAFGSAQESINFASLSGRVADASGAVIAGARVNARQVDTNLRSTALTDQEGRFRFPFLRLGLYEVMFQKDGFQQSQRRLQLTVGSAFELPVTLDVASVQSVDFVSADTPVLEAARTQIAGTVPQTEVRSLPLNGRNFLDLALLVPGVSPTNTASNQLFAETSAVPGQGISVGSQRNFSNNFIVDGLSANDDAAGLSGIFYGLDVVNEFQVVTSGGQAEFGRALGGYINVVTKSGTNTLHGDLYGYFRNQRFNAANALSHTELPLTQAQYGASLGGPIVRDRTFYFANFEQRELNQSGLITIAPANVGRDQRAARRRGLSGPADLNRPVSESGSQHATSWRRWITSSARAISSAFATASTTSTARTRAARAALNAATASAGLDNTDQTVAVSNVATLSPRTVNETRAQFTEQQSAARRRRIRSARRSASRASPRSARSPDLPPARLNKLYEDRRQPLPSSGRARHPRRRRFPVQRRHHHLSRDPFAAAIPSRRWRTFSRGTYNNSGFTQTFGNTVVAQTNPNVGFYAQDEWKVNPRLTLNLGLRYDLQFLQTIATDTNNISPRAGFAWSPFASRQHGGSRQLRPVLRPRSAARAGQCAALGRQHHRRRNLSQISVSLSPAQTGAPVFPEHPGEPDAAAGRAVQLHHHEPPHAERLFRAGQLRDRAAARRAQHVERRLPASARTAPDRVGESERAHLRRRREATTDAARIPTYGNNSQYSSLADSHYDGLHVSFVQRPVRWGSYRVSYTYSKALDNVGEFFFSSPIDNFNIWQDYGRSDDDQRHRLVFNGNAHFLGFEFGTMLQIIPLCLSTSLQVATPSRARLRVRWSTAALSAGTRAAASTS